MTSEVTVPPSRSALIRQAVLYTPLFVATAVLFLLTLVGVIKGGIVMYIFLVIGVLLFGYQSIQALRDLRTNPVVTQGAITRIWSKMDFFVSRSYYIAMRRTIFRIPVTDYYDLREEAKRMRADGTDEDYRIEVRVTHFPHTGNVISLERTGLVPVRDEGEETDGAKQAKA